MLNMYNAVSFLGEGRYVPAQQAAAAGAAKVSTATFTRKTGGQKAVAQSNSSRCSADVLYDKAGKLQR